MIVFMSFKFVNITSPPGDRDSFYEYTYSFTSTSNGKLTVFAYLESNISGIYAIFWNNLNLSGNPDKTWIYSSIVQRWNTLVTTNQLAPTSGRFTTYLAVPQNDTYTIYYKHDNGGRLYFSGSLATNNWVNTVSEESFTMTLNTATKYSITAEFFNTGGPAQAYLSWSYTGQTKQYIPSSAFSYISFTSSSPLAVTVGPTWGDGYWTPSEQWDDGTY